MVTWRSGTTTCSRAANRRAVVNLHSTAFNDIIDGGAGTDASVWSCASGNFTLGFANDAWIVQDKTGARSIDKVSNVERLQFADKTVITETMAHGSYAELPAPQ